jgi:hypothetical protein
MPNARTSLYQIVQDRLEAATGQRLPEFITVRRAPGSTTPYRHIAQEIIELTGVDITHEAVRRWHHKIQEATA